VSAQKLILVVLATVVIFATGVVTGGLLVRQSRPPPLPPPPGPQLFPGRFDALRTATDQLEDLTPAQRARINRIIRDGRERIADFFLLFEPDIQGVFRKMREDIRAELTPDQRRRLEEFFRQRARRMEERGGFRPGDRPLPPRFRGPPPLQPEFDQPAPGPRQAPSAAPRDQRPAPPPEQPSP
jgi:Spy/CpxP family protein refolding chaperone